MGTWYQKNATIYNMEASCNPRPIKDDDGVGEDDDDGPQREGGKEAP